MKYAILPVLFFLSTIPLFAQEMEINSGDPTEFVYHKDSIGNIISYQQFLELVRSGDYVAVPSFDPSTGMQHIAKSKDRVDLKRNNSYTDGKTIISTVGALNVDLSYSMGDTVSSICATNSRNAINCIGSAHPQDRNTLMVVADKKNWPLVQKDLSAYAMQYPNLHVIVSMPDNKKISLTSLYDQRFLARHQNIFLAENNQVDHLTVAEYPYFYLINPAGKVYFYFPPMRSEHMRRMAVSGYLERTE